MHDEYSEMYALNYDADDFPEIDCIQVTDLTKYTGNRAKQQMLSQNVPSPSDQKQLVNLETYNQILSLKLKHPSKENVLAAVKALETREDVFYACPDQTLSACSTTANDTYYDEQWAIDKMQLPQAWDIETGSSTVLVGVMDSGIDGTHPDLVAHRKHGLREK
ncbi:MAG: hypothetical protein IJF33_05035 [Clostridia bacterium]|nr:hypothetical protein [Clostridia bacterium]